MARLRVLIADDSEFVQRAVARVLQDEFDVVGVVSTGRDLVDAVLTIKPDVIVSDLEMPSLSGGAALRTLRDAGDTTPFVLLTAVVRHAQQWIGKGALGVVDKSDLDVELVAAVRAAAAGEIYISRSARGPVT